MNNETNGQTASKIREIFSQKLGIVEVEKMVFQRCHRLGPRNRNNSSFPRDIIVRFAFYPDREKVWENRQKLKGSDMIMNGDFPEEINERRAILYRIFKIAKDKHHKAKLVADKLIIDGIRYTVDSLEKLPKDLHPRAFAERYTDNSVIFYGGYSIYSNFYKVNFEIDGRKYNSVEQYFQYKKAVLGGHRDVAEQILCSTEPKEQYLFGKKLNPCDQWNDKLAKQTMEKAIRAKFEQNQELHQEIMKTDNKTFIECNPHDLYWANGLKMTSPAAEDETQWKGQNVLGTILCSVRNSLK